MARRSSVMAAVFTNSTRRIADWYNCPGAGCGPEMALEDLTPPEQLDYPAIPDDGLQARVDW